MKKFVHMFLVIGLILTMTGCNTVQKKDTLIVGSEAFSGYFLPSEGMGNGVADVSIRNLLHGGATVSTDENGKLILNESVIKTHTREEQEDGSVIYTITLQDMMWSDGTSITSDDYLFGFLLAASPAYSEAGALDATGEGLLGYWDYYDGIDTYFKGIKRIDEKTFTMQIDAAELPYFWEYVYVSVTPYPMHALIAPQDAIVSDENGSTFNGDMATAVQNFTTIYNETQTPSCGPYTLESYENGQVSLLANPNYMGDIHGNKPSIEHVIVKEVYEETAMDALLAGEIDILEPVLQSSLIETGLQAEKDGKVQAVNFPRNGYGVFATKDNFSATKEVEVRRALAYLLDREALVNDVMGGYGEVIDSDYALDQWMVKELKEVELPYAYAYSIKKANAQLNDSSYRFEADGITAWDEAKVAVDYYRYNANKEVLEIRHLATDNNNVSDIVEQQLSRDAIQVGIKYTMERTDEAGLQDAYYFSEEDGKESIYNAFTLGIEFASIPDPYYASISCDFVNTSANPSNYCDPHMEDLIATMRHTEQEDIETFSKAWKAYIDYYNETLPQIPLYTSTHYGFANANLEGYKSNAYYDWSDQIASLSWK